MPQNEGRHSGQQDTIPSPPSGSMPPTRSNPFAQYAFVPHGQEDDDDDGNESDATVDYDGDTHAEGSRPSIAIQISEDDDDHDDNDVRPSVASAYKPPPPLLSAQLRAPQRQCPHDNDDADDDLLALGCASSSAAATRAVSSAASPVLPNPNLTMPTGKMQLSRGMRTLHWHSPNSGQRRLIMELFQQQFGTVLNNTEELREAFAPFARPKALAKILSGSPAHKKGGYVLDEAPLLTPDVDTGSLPGFQLRSYQITGVQFLLNCFHRGMSAILGDDMGLGKTAQVCTLLSLLHKVHNIPGPHLLIVPLSTISAWMRELGRWAPSLHVVKCQGDVKTRQSIITDRHNRFSVFITTSQTFVSDRAFYKKRVWVCAVVDEAHILKGETTIIAQQVRKIDACCRIAVTGTPVHNRVSEVWSLLGFLYPFLDVAASSPDALDHPEADCARLLQFVMLRRTKGSLEELGIPPKVELPVTMVKATRMQRALFDLVASKALLLAAMNDEAEDQEPLAEDNTDDDGDGPKPKHRRRRDPTVTALRKQRVEERKRDYRQQSRALYVFFTRQRHICNHPLALQLLLQRRRKGRGNGGGAEDAATLTADAKKAMGESYSSQRYGASDAAQRVLACGIPIDDAHIVQPSAKMRELDVMLTSLHAEGHRVLIFSNFTTTLDLIEGMCLLRGYHYDRLDGSTTRVERELSMIKYNHVDSKVFVFLLTTPAGGVGITLTGADTVILFDSHYNPQIDRQAMDRAHRIGQTRTVRVYRMCVQGSMEEHIQRIAQHKARLGDAIVETAILGGGGAKHARSGAATEKTAFSVEQLRKMFQETSAASAADAAIDVNVADDEVVAMSQSDGSSGDSGAIHQKLLDEIIQLAEAMSNGQDDDGDEEYAADEVMRYLGLGNVAMGKSNVSGVGAALPHTHVCFDCGERMRPMEPLYHCSMCTKAYHPDCIPDSHPRPGAAGKPVKNWSCPRHWCAACEKPQGADGALFACTLCSIAYCVDCMDSSRYFTLAADGVTFSNISHTYFDMEKEGMPVKKSLYYVTCMKCAGVESSTGSEADEVSDGEDGSGFESEVSTSESAQMAAAIAASLSPQYQEPGGANADRPEATSSASRSPIFLLDDE